MTKLSLLFALFAALLALACASDFAHKNVVVLTSKTFDERVRARGLGPPPRPAAADADARR